MPDFNFEISSFNEAISLIYLCQNKIKLENKTLHLCEG